MALPGTIAGAPYPILSKRFDFSTTSAGLEFFDLDVQHVDSVIRFDHNGTGQKVFRLPLAASVSAGASILITWGTIPGGSAVAAGPADGSSDTFNFDGTPIDTGGSNAAFLCIRTPIGMEGTTNNWNVIRFHNSDFV